MKPPNHTGATLAGVLISKIRHWPSWLWNLEARVKGIEIGNGVEFIGRPLLSRAHSSRIVLGDRVCVASALRSNPLGLAQPSVLRALAPGAELILGEAVGISGTVICAGKSIHIGEQTIVGAGAMILDNDFHVPLGQWGWGTDSSSTARPVRIGRGVFIGARAIVLKGVTIGDRAVIGAGAVVSKDVPEHHMAAGNPARVFSAKEAPSGSRV